MSSRLAAWSVSSKAAAHEPTKVMMPAVKGARVPYHRGLAGTSSALALGLIGMSTALVFAGRRAMRNEKKRHEMHRNFAKVVLLATEQAARTAKLAEGAKTEGLPGRHSGAVSADERKLRSAIENIVRDQEDMRIATELVTSDTLFAAGGAFGLAGIATLATLLPVWYAALVPTLTSAIFVASSAAESSGTRSAGIARYNSGQATAVAAQQETILAEAEIRKAELPFTVGLTAILAAGCVLVRTAFEQNEGIGLMENMLLLIAASVLVGASLAGSVLASYQAVRMRAALTLKDEEKKEGESLWESQRLPKVARDEDQNEVILVGLATLTLSFVPLLFVDHFQPQFVDPAILIDPTWLQEKSKLINECSVLTSGTAAAQAAITYLLAEKEFSDAERRIGVQARQAALANLFYAQSQAEASVLPVRTAMSGAALGGADLAVEFSRLVSSLMPWPVFISAVRSTLTAILVKSEASAARLERRISKKGKIQTTKGQDVLSSTLRELNRLGADFKSDPFGDELREVLASLPKGASKEFRALPGGKRRKVHLVAAEMGMVSESTGTASQRVVIVKNTSSAVVAEVVPKDTRPWTEIVTQEGSNFVNQFNQDVKSIIQGSLESDSKSLVYMAVAASAFGFMAPIVGTKAVAELVVPTVTGGVGLLTVWQEREGKQAVAKAKKESANLLKTQSEAEALHGLAMMAYGALPTLFAVATCATTASVIGVVAFHATVGRWLACATLPCVGIAALSCAVAVNRQRRVQQYIKSAVRAVDGQPPPQSLVSNENWWQLPVAIALTIPVPLPHRVSIACALFMAQVGLLMACCSEQLAAGQFATGRSGRTTSRADAWSQQASTSIRALPVESAAAIVNTLLATSLVALATPLGVAFPVVGLGVCLRAIRYGNTARLDANKVRNETGQIQRLEGVEAPPWQSASTYEGAANVGTSTGVPGAQATTVVDLEELNVGRVKKRGAFSRIGKKLRNSWRMLQKNSVPDVKKLKKQLQRFIRMWDEAGPEGSFVQDPAEVAVKSVQADMDELLVSRGSMEKSWSQTGILVGACTAASVISPFVFPMVVSTVVLPIAGAGLTIFAVQAESQARRSVAASKVWAAELMAAASTMEELTATAMICRARLIAMTALTAAVAVAALVVEHPWPVVKYISHIEVVQRAFQTFLAISSVAATAWSVRPLNSVFDWAEQANEITVESLRKVNCEGDVQGKPPGRLPLQAPMVEKRMGLRWTFIVGMIPLLFLIFPLNRHFAKKVVASTACGACIMAIALWGAESVSAKAERMVSRRLRTQALADAFSNEAEQQGALLPPFSAAAIAFSAVITFAVELNVYIASGLTILQALSWVLASRKAVATKFEASAALQVDAVTEGRLAYNPLQGASKFKQFLLNWAGAPLTGEAAHREAAKSPFKGWTAFGRKSKPAPAKRSPKPSSKDQGKTGQPEPRKEAAHDDDDIEHGRRHMHDHMHQVPEVIARAVEAAIPKPRPAPRQDDAHAAPAAAPAAAHASATVSAHATAGAPAVPLTGQASSVIENAPLGYLQPSDDASKEGSYERVRERTHESA